MNGFAGFIAHMVYAEIGALPMCGRPVPLIQEDGTSRDHVTYNTDDANTPNEKW